MIYTYLYPFFFPLEINKTLFKFESIYFYFSKQLYLNSFFFLLLFLRRRRFIRLKLEFVRLPSCTTIKNKIKIIKIYSKGSWSVANLVLFLFLFLIDINLKYEKERKQPETKDD